VERQVLWFGLLGHESRKHPVQKPAFVRQAAEQPEALAGGRFDAVVIADQMRFRIANPPFAADALRPISARATR
jgi:hypothetical protein